MIMKMWVVVYDLVLGCCCSVVVVVSMSMLPRANVAWQTTTKIILIRGKIYQDLIFH